MGKSSVASAGVGAAALTFRSASRALTCAVQCGSHMGSVDL